MSSPDLGITFNDPRLQQFMIRNSERYLGLEDMLEAPSVVFNRGGMDDFWVTATNSVRRDEIFARIRSNELIPVNADALQDFGNNHALFHYYLHTMGIPTIPTIIGLDGGPVACGDLHVETIDGVYFVKKSREGSHELSHGGRGISIVKITPENVDDYLPRDLFSFLQPFVLPPGDFVRDTRVYMVGGEPVAGSVRRAQLPLTKGVRSGLYLPSELHYPSARRPGPSERLEGDLKEATFAAARQIAAALEDVLRARKRPYSPFSIFGYGSIDFVQDSNGNPLPVDFDVSPSVTTFDGIDDIVAQRVAEYLRSLSEVGGSK